MKTRISKELKRKALNALIDDKNMVDIFVELIKDVGDQTSYDTFCGDFFDDIDKNADPHSYKGHTVATGTIKGVNKKIQVIYPRQYNESDLLKFDSPALGIYFVKNELVGFGLQNFYLTVETETQFYRTAKYVKAGIPLQEKGYKAIRNRSSDSLAHHLLRLDRNNKSRADLLAFYIKALPAEKLQGVVNKLVDMSPRQLVRAYDIAENLKLNLCE
jgi:hypothetical protein